MLSHPIDNPDIRELAVHIGNLSKRLDEITIRMDTGFDKVFSIQGEQYETIRRRIHDAVNDMNRGLGAETIRSQDVRNQIEDKINDLERGHHLMARDIEQINKTLAQNSETRAEYHKSLMDSIERLHLRADSTDEKMTTHIREEMLEKKRILIWLVLLFGTAVVAYTIYIWDKLGVNP